MHFNLLFTNMKYLIDIFLVKVFIQYYYAVAFTNDLHLTGTQYHKKTHSHL